MRQAPVPDLVPVYDLRFDPDHIRNVQQASLGTTGSGLTTDPWLFGSPDWWQALSEGRLETLEIRGVISRVFLSGHNDYEEFEIDDGQERSSWTRRTSDIPGNNLPRRELAKLYQEGSSARLFYTLYPFKMVTRGLGESSRCVLRIMISPAA